MRKYVFNLSLMIAACLLPSCIENDIPYPRIQPDFTTFVVEGESAPATIDTESRVVTVNLPESVNPYTVKVNSFSLNPDNSTVVDSPFDSPLNLSSPVEVTVRLYQDYTWTIKASQVIERYFTIANQIGTSEIDEANHRIIAYVSDITPLTDVQVTSFKLGPQGATYQPDLTGAVVDFTEPVKVDVTAWDHQETWTIYVEPTQATVTTTSVDAWTCVAWVHGIAEVGSKSGVEYRMQGTSEWTVVPEADLQRDEGAFTARLIHLQPATAYEARAFSGNEVGATLTFTTGIEAQLPNASMSQWWLDGKMWCPWAEGSESFWDTGNKGSAIVGKNITTPTDDTSTGTGKAAKCQSENFYIKFAAASIFTGQYVETVGTDGRLKFGRPYTQRPTKLRVHLKYFPTPITQAKSPYESLKGQPDTCQVYIALIDSPQPMDICTKASERKLFSPNDPSVLAYGAFQSGKEIPTYTAIDIPLGYKSTSRIPTHIIIVCSASKYGDFFTGGNGSTLYLDDFELLYDY